MTSSSVITETIFISDTRAGHRSGPTSKPRGSNRAQLTCENEGRARVPAVVANQVLSGV